MNQEQEQEFKTLKKAFNILKSNYIDLHLLKWCFWYYRDRDNSALANYNEDTMGDELEIDEYLVLKEAFGHGKSNANKR